MLQNAKNGRKLEGRWRDALKRMVDSVRKNGAVTVRSRSHNKDVSLLYYIFGYFLTMVANPH